MVSRQGNGVAEVLAIPIRAAITSGTFPQEVLRMPRPTRPKASRPTSPTSSAARKADLPAAGDCATPAVGNEMGNAVGNGAQGLDLGRWPFSPVCCGPDAFSLMHQQTLPDEQGNKPGKRLDSDDGLLAAACAVALHARPDVEVSECDEAIEELTNDVCRRHADVFGTTPTAGDLAARAAVAPQAAMAYVHEALFEGGADFSGNNGDFYNPANSFLPCVLESRRGLPISLALVYKLVAGRIGLKCWGVGLPGHFLAGVECGGPVLVDCFHGGRLLDRRDAAERVAACVGPDAEFDDELLRPVTHRHWVTRLIQNLLQTYTGAGRYADVAAMLELELLLWPDQYHLQRDLGLVLARLGQPRPAAVWLGQYLDHRPDDPQRADLEELMGVLN